MTKTLSDPADMTPELLAEERGELSTSIMSVPGDPVLDMAKSLRNIEWLLSDIHHGMSILLHRGISEANDEQPTATVARGKRTDSQSKANGQ